MKNLNIIFFLGLLCCSVSVYATAVDGLAAVGNSTLAKPDTLARRHPFLAVSAAFFLRKTYANYAGDGKDGILLIDGADFSLALLFPSVLGEEDFYAGAALSIASTMVKHPSQIPPPGAALSIASTMVKHPSQIPPPGAKDFQGPSLHPIWYAGALTHISIGMRKLARPWVNYYSNETVFENYTNATQYVVPLVTNFAPFLVVFFVKREFNGLIGTLAKGAGIKTVYVSCEGVENLILTALQVAAGDQVFVEPVAEAGTAVVLGYVAYCLNQASETLTKTLPVITENMKKSAIERATRIAAQKSGLIQLFGVRSVYVAASLSDFLGNIASDYAGYAATTAVFKTVEKTTPNGAPYINPALGVAVVALATYQTLWGRLRSGPDVVKSAASGAAFAGFLQILGALFSLPGWIEDIPAQWARQAYSGTSRSGREEL
jgi:hypothetical protein